MKDFFTKEAFAFLIIGILFGSAYYNFYLAPRDEALRAIMDCMQDLHSKTEYDRCAQQTKGEVE